MILYFPIFDDKLKYVGNCIVMLLLIHSQDLNNEIDRLKKENESMQIELRYCIYTTLIYLIPPELINYLNSSLCVYLKSQSYNLFEHVTFQALEGGGY